MEREIRGFAIEAPHRLSVSEAVALLGSDVRSGLTEEEAVLRLERFGPNRLAEPSPVPAWRKFLIQFSDTLVLLLIAAGFLSALIWWMDRESSLPYEAMAIFSIVILNAVMGYVQQARAEEALKALKEMSAPQATVIRGGKQRRIATAALVPGDIVLVEEGDTVPADARLIEGSSLKMAEASLTGESLPIHKDAAPIEAEASVGDRLNMLFSGTSVVGGHARALVTATGMKTETGYIAAMLETASDDVTPLQKELDRVGRSLGIVVVAIAAAMIAMMLLLTGYRDLSHLFGILIFGVALAVAAVPEGLPAIVTAVLSIGVQRMAARRAIVRRLAAVETLGSANVIASDKTGTLTRNEMTVRSIVTASGRADFDGIGYAPDGDLLLTGEDTTALEVEIRLALTAAECANNASLHDREGRWIVHGDPTEIALLTATRKAGGLSAAHLDRVAEIPFSSERKLMTTIHRDPDDGGLCAFTKGAPDTLLAHCTRELVGGEACSLTPSRRAEILTRNDALATAALRTLAVAYRRLSGGGSEGSFPDAEQDLVFIGLIGMIDPPRDEVRAAVRTAKDAGIRVMMITGDHPTTAGVIAESLGISSKHVITGAELARMRPEELDCTVRDASVYARVDPAHKLAIVAALQRQGAIVAMTGDGVNDAPALKAADIGVAMGITGTDVSKGAADIVLADDNFATIVAAVEEGRAIFSNIRKFLRYLLSSNIGEVATMFLGVLLAGVLGLADSDGSGITMPLLAAQILWINLITDGAPALALGLDPASKETMSRPPRPVSEGVITGTMWWGILFVGGVMASGTLLVLDACLPGGMIEGTGSLAFARTMAFTTLTLFQLFNVFNARSDERSVFVGLFSNLWLWGAVMLSILLHMAVLYLPFLNEAFSTVPLTLGNWGVCVAVASSIVWLRELTKVFARCNKPDSDHQTAA